MSRKPMTAIRVSELDRSIAFYTGRLGFELVEREVDSDVAVVDAGGYRVLLAGPEENDLSGHLDETHDLVKVGATVFAFAADLDACHAELVERGTADAQIIQRPWGDRMIQVLDPDGYTVRFWTPTERSRDEAIRLYAIGPEELEGALRGLSEVDLDLSSRPGHWSIRQITHHLSDSEAAVLGRVLSALAEPGKVYVANPYSQDAWAESLDYAGRPTEPSVALFRAIRGQLLQLVNHLPGAWDRTYRTPEGSEWSVSTLINMLSSHALEHIEEVRQIRRDHGC